MTKDNSGGVVPRGFGERSRVLIRGFGEYILSQILPKKFKPNKREREYLFEINVPIYKENIFDLKLLVPFSKNAINSYSILQRIYFEKEMNYKINSGLIKQMELEYLITTKMNNKKLINALELLFDDE